MIEQKIVIRNELGLHARPAAEFVKAAMRYKSTVLLAKNDEWVNGKSVLGILTLAAEQGETLTIRIENKDDAAEERAAFAALVAILGSNEKETAKNNEDQRTAERR